MATEKQRGALIAISAIGPLVSSKKRQRLVLNAFGGDCVGQGEELMHDSESIALHPTDYETVGPFTWRRYAPLQKVQHSVIVLDDELVGDAAISALRARTIDGTINGVELILVGFAVDRFGPLHRARGRYFTNDEHDLVSLGMPETGEGEVLRQFIEETILTRSRAPVGLLGYSPSGAFAIDLFSRFEMLDRLGLVSPTFWIDDGSVNKLASSAARRRESKIFLTVGERESDIVANDGTSMRDQIAAAAALIGREYGSQIVYLPISEADHISIVTNAIDRAVRFFGR